MTLTMITIAPRGLEVDIVGSRLGFGKSWSIELSCFFRRSMEWTKNRVSFDVDASSGTSYFKSRTQGDGACDFKRGKRRFTLGLDPHALQETKSNPLPVTVEHENRRTCAQSVAGGGP
jgi:hypothetical protein